MSAAPARRTLLLGATALLLAGPVRAEEAEAPAAAPKPPAAAPAEATPPRPRPRRRATRRPPPPPEPDPEPQVTGPHFDPAPVPNRDMEGPKIAAPSESPSFGPSIIHRSLPNTAAAREGSRNYDEERLFFPAPGARLTVPFR